MQQVAAGVTQLQIQRFVNLYFVETTTRGEWVLVDTGLPGHAKDIIAAANQLFYVGTTPVAILLTHGHMDHAGNAQELSEHWNVPVYAHRLELTFLTGKAVYPPADPTVGGSLGFASRFFPPQSFNLSRVQALPEGAEVPYLPGWQMIHVPGHAPGQVALFRTEDKTLLGADAFATACHDSIPSLMLQLPKISRAGTPFNYDWEATHASVVELANLEPNAIGCGHGPVITGPEAAAGLTRLARNFPVPAQGRYVAQPARTDADGVQFVPPEVPDTLPRSLAVVGIGAAVIGLAALLTSQRRTRRATRYVPGPRYNADLDEGYYSGYGTGSRQTHSGSHGHRVVTGPGPSRPDWRRGGVGS
ncbi:MBL fold metallo-hydrolase [Hymenobacter sp. BT175]|uniref:MBL fold metallo-hydrolase n=1 Tax=Hymenobacter translucens TaxID=2886507 RepID=UPI001D0E4615|nr:MBL fold metallo-hydrolase [Hymenobacter translucens]MCC2545413.1 MBL fold metallo-hydrolase [Hymenobacter translucens]